MRWQHPKGETPCQTRSWASLGRDQLLKLGLVLTKWNNSTFDTQAFHPDKIYGYLQDSFLSR